MWFSLHCNFYFYFLFFFKSVYQDLDSIFSEFPFFFLVWIPLCWSCFLTLDLSGPADVFMFPCKHLSSYCLSWCWLLGYWHVCPLRGNWTKGASWFENMENVQIFPSVGFIWLFCFAWNSSSSRTEPHQLSLYQWKTEKGWLVTYVRKYEIFGIFFHTSHSPSLVYIM